MKNRFKFKTAYSVQLDIKPTQHLHSNKINGFDTTVVGDLIEEQISYSFKRYLDRHLDKKKGVYMHKRTSMDNGFATIWYA